MSCAVNPRRTAVTLRRQALPDRPGRTYRRRTDYHFNVWRPFRRAHSNLLARVRIFIKKGPRWRSPGSLSLLVLFSPFVSLSFSSIQRQSPLLRDELLYGFLSGEAEQEGSDSGFIHTRAVMIEESIVRVNKVLTDFMP